MYTAVGGFSTQLIIALWLPDSEMSLVVVEGLLVEDGIVVAISVGIDAGDDEGTGVVVGGVVCNVAVGIREIKIVAAEVNHTSKAKEKTNSTINNTNNHNVILYNNIIIVIISY